MKSKLKFILVFLSLNVISNVYSQKVKQADELYNRFAYIDAIKIYEGVAEKGYEDEKIFQKLGNAYYFNAEFEKAAKWYDKLFLLNPEQESEYYYRYSQCLKSVGDYAKADKLLLVFYEKSGFDQRAKLFEKNKNYLETIKSNSGRFIIWDAGINSEYSDYGSTLFDNKLIFTSTRDTGGISKKVFRWDNQYFSNLYASEVKSDGTMGESIKFQRNKINSKFHESTPVFTKDGKTMYFTRNNYLDGKIGKDGNRIILLKIYKATLVNNNWSNVHELPFDSNNYSVAHPMLSNDDKTLFFVSDMPGTIGQSDIFKVAINSDGTFGIPENLGTTINTQGRETFPFITEDNELYYASDGHPGLGGLDVFVSKIEKDGSISESQNIGEPINSGFDDFAFIIDNKTRRGFFTSNRVGGHGFDDIYKFTEIKKLNCEQILAGIITDKESGEIIAGAKVILFDENHQQLKEGVSDQFGNYHFDVICGKKYYVRVSKENYESNEGNSVIGNTSGKTDLPLKIEKRIKAIGVDSDLAKVLSIPMIFFDLDKSFIRKDAAIELEKIIVTMTQYPSMKIDVRSHTDCRQSAKYNQELSDRRVKSTIAWLIKNGINPSRLAGRGYGESRLLNNCGCEPSNKSNCTEEEHQLNRRSEFIIVSM
ncbi:OmpA family protein [Flavobacterium gilvum]|uniref:Flagellar motor protein MotB n=1 Tax=Flavobacterium gilvum TaxID=1492737 RepID=A0AAC9I725_9FLAO|nr:OmpA family protein [Flavobacterium gilvum]AOW11390.1 flagellar motor protein MotB [Flavobacterium gilvum]KFC60694.1 cell envelope biogenesis protein OmpA [Flavobacterium gilvum]